MGKDHRAGGVPLAPARPARVSLAEIGALSWLTLSLAFLVLFTVAGANWATLWDLTVDAGDAVLNELGWVFGVYVPTLLGFYVLVIGEQLTQTTNPWRLRRLLGGVAELSFAALVPGILLVGAYCLSDPTQIGPLFVITPATLLLLFLTTQLGGFVVFDTSIQLADATQARTLARTQLAALTPRSRRRTWMVIVVNVAVVAAAGWVAISATGGWEWGTHWETAAVAVAWSLFVSILAVLVAAAIATHSMLGWICAALTLGLIWASTAGSCWALLTQAGANTTPIVVGITLITGVLTWSALWPPNRSPRFIVNWTLAGALTATTARRTARAYRRTTERITLLNTMLTEPPRKTLRQRMNTALSALRPS